MDAALILLDARLFFLFTRRGARRDEISSRELTALGDQYRVTFRWESGHAYEVCVEDYH